MHGMIFQQLQNFVIEKFDVSLWLQLKKQSGLEKVYFTSTEKYPDSYIEDFILHTTKHLNISREHVLESFGIYLGPKLIEQFSFYINSNWQALDVIENTEEYIHKSLKLADSNVDTPELKVHRKSDNLLELTYTSDRKMIALGIGIINGIGKHFGESLTINRLDYTNKTILEILKT